jgi:long-chain fatty acid transport protein
MKWTKHKPTIAMLAFTGTALVAAGGAHASGFALVEQGIKQVGSAISGGAASAEDASTIFFNPAGMTRLDGSQIATGVHYVIPSADFSGRATTNAALGGAAIGGGDGGDAGAGTPIPTFFYAHKLNDQVMLGLGISAPFGLATEYDDDWIGRYHATTSELETININPSIAYKVDDHLSLGAGINIMRAGALLANVVDYSAACMGYATAGVNGVVMGDCAGAGLLTPGTPATDGEFEVEGVDWGYGFNLGLLYEFNENTRVGIAYRSKVKQTLTGNADFTPPSGVAVPANVAAVLADSDAIAKVTLPASLSLSLTTRVAPKWDLMADVTWTDWSQFKELRVEFDNPLKSDSVQPENWEDTYKFSIGFTYYHNAKWTWRGGIAYDQTPVPNSVDRTPRIPGHDRTWLAAGLSYKMSPKVTLDLSLAHLFVDDADVNATDTSFGHTLVGSYDADVNIISAGLVYQF